MSDRTSLESQKSRSEKFKQAAREAECDEDEARWEKRMRKLAKGKWEQPAKD